MEKLKTKIEKPNSMSELKEKVDYLESVILISDPIELGKIRNEICRRDKKVIPCRRLHERVLSYFSRKYVDNGYDDPELLADLKDELLREAQK